MTDPWKAAVRALEQACCVFDDFSDAQQLAVLARLAEISALERIAALTVCAEIAELERIWRLDAPDALHCATCSSPNDQRPNDDARDGQRLIQKENPA